VFALRVSAKAIGVVVIAVVLSGFVAPAASAIGPCTGGELYVVAHQDDSLLFQSPELLKDVQVGHCVQTVFLTAGDAGRGSQYWEGREAGAEAAYAQMAGVLGFPSAWVGSDPLVSGHQIHLETLPGTGLSMVYLRLPDGNVNGEGFMAYGFQSLIKLWRSVNGGVPTITNIKAVDNSAEYSYSGLVETVATLITSFGPAEIDTQNYLQSFPGPDHPDHVATGYFTKLAQSSYGSAHLLRGFEDYETLTSMPKKPANVPEPLLAAKQAAFLAYVPHDEACASHEEECEGPPYTEWLEREYVAKKESVPGAVAGTNQTVLPGAPVQLDGSGSFDPGDSTPSLTYAWVQTGDPKVTLSSPTTAKPTFTAPASPTTLVFSLKVKNGAENGSHESLASSVTVNVENPPSPPPPNNGGGGGGNPPPPPKNIVVKLSKAKVKLVVGKQSKHVVKVIAPGKSAVMCRGQLPKGARCRVNAQHNVVIEGSKSVKRSGTFHLVINFAYQAGAGQRPLTVVFKRPGR
jgi:LmbE family N-acetylglucosaminyl deacetylase